MCMLSYFPEGIVPDPERIRNGSDVNPDGFGYAIVTGDRRLLINKSMNADELIEAFMSARKRNPEGPALFHSRIGTSGQLDITGCHPFKVGHDNRTVIAHNGILFSPPAGSFRSDTRIFAEDILPTMARFDSAKRFRKLERHVGWSNKLVVLTVNPRYRNSSYLINGDMGNWVAGEWHSNHDWDGRSMHAWKSYSSSKPWWDERADESDGREPWPCDYCESRYAVDTMTLLCEVCRTCNDCGMYVEECFCFYGGQAARKGTKSAEESARVFIADSRSDLVVTNGYPETRASKLSSIDR